MAGRRDGDARRKIDAGGHVYPLGHDADADQQPWLGRHYSPDQWEGQRMHDQAIAKRNAAATPPIKIDSSKTMMGKEIK